MQIKVNGQTLECPEGASVQDIIVQLGHDPAHVVVERNREILPGEAFPATRVDNGDVLEILHFVGGG